MDVVGSESCFWILTQAANTGLAAGRVLGKQTLRQSGVCAGCLLRVSEGLLPVRGVERGSVAKELQWGPVASANPVQTAGTEMVCQHCPERVRHGPLFPSPRQPSGVGCTPKGHAWARQFFVAEHALKRQPCQQAAPGSGWGWFVFTMVVSWRRHYVRALQMESKGMLTVYKMLAVWWLRRECDGCRCGRPIAPGTYLLPHSFSAPLGTARPRVPAPCLLMQKAGL